MQRANARNVLLLKRMAQTALNKGNGAALNTSTEQSKKSNERNQQEHQSGSPTQQKPFPKNKVMEDPTAKIVKNTPEGQKEREEQASRSRSPTQQKQSPKPKFEEGPSTTNIQKSQMEELNADQKRTAEESAKRTSERVWKVGAELEK